MSAACAYVTCEGFQRAGRWLDKLAVYAREFELSCSKFGYCDDHEYTCIRGVESMCPEKLFKWDKSQKQYLPK